MGLRRPIRACRRRGRTWGLAGDTGRRICSTSARALGCEIDSKQGKAYDDKIGREVEGKGATQLTGLKLMVVDVGKAAAAAMKRAGINRLRRSLCNNGHVALFTLQQGQVATVWRWLQAVQSKKGLMDVEAADTHSSTGRVNANIFVIFFSSRYWVSSTIKK